jgi:hypothetical protein
VKKDRPPDLPEALKRELLKIEEIGAEHRAAVRDELKRIRPIVDNEFPPEPDSILPTRFGNVMESYRGYSYQRYGIDARALWPRLVTVLDKDYAAALEDAQVPLRFMLNSSVLSIFLAVFFLAIGLHYSPLLANRQWLRWYALGVLVCGVLSYLCYRGAIHVASTWSEKYQSAFDLYRWNLLEKLGYKRTPTTRKEERILWEAISNQTHRPGASTSPLLDYTVIAPEASLAYARDSSEPPNDPPVDLEVARGIQPPKNDRFSLLGDERVTVVLQVRNVDRLHRTAQKVVVTDRLLHGYDYEWRSAKQIDERDGSEIGTVPVVGTNPYHFHVNDPLTHNSQFTLSYRMIPRRKGEGANK